MQIYTDRCPFCGTHIAIEDATLCSGCKSQIFYGPLAPPSYASPYASPDSEILKVNRERYYWPNRHERDVALKAFRDFEAAQRAYWESPAGIEQTKRKWEEIEQNHERAKAYVDEKKFKVL